MFKWFWTIFSLGAPVKWTEASPVNTNWTYYNRHNTLFGSKLSRRSFRFSQIRSVICWRVLHPLVAMFRLIIKAVTSAISSASSILRFMASIVSSLGELASASWKLESHADVLRGLSRVPTPLKSADLSGKRRRPITTDFQDWEVHFRLWEISRLT